MGRLTRTAKSLIPCLRTHCVLGVVLPIVAKEADMVLAPTFIKPRLQVIHSRAWI